MDNLDVNEPKKEETQLSIEGHLKPQYDLDAINAYYDRIEEEIIKNGGPGAAIR